MNEYQNSGALFKARAKEKDTWPDYEGSATVDGVDYWISSWLKKGKDGKAFMSLAFKPKEPKANTRTHSERRRGEQDDSSESPF